VKHKAPLNPTAVEEAVAKAMTWVGLTLTQEHALRLVQEGKVTITVKRDGGHMEGDVVTGWTSKRRIEE